MQLYRTRGDRVLDIVIIAILIVVSIIVLYPIWFVLIASVSLPAEIGNGNVLLLPKGFNLEGYSVLLKHSEIWIGYRNSLFYMLVGTLIDLFVTLPCAYALSRKSMPLRRMFSFVFVFTMYFTGGIIPMYMLLRDFNMLDTMWALVIPGSLSVYNMIIARSYFENSLPEPIYESAIIDGSSKTRFFLQFALPLSKSMIAVITLFYALGHWNAYLGAMMYIQTPAKQTLQVILKGITAELSFALSESSGAAELIALAQQKQLLKYSVVVVSAIPMLLLYPLVQKYIVKGIMVGAVKG